MAWPKGKKRPPGWGRKKGVPNKVTRNARAQIGKLLDGKAHLLPKWLEDIRKNDGPAAAVKAYTGLLEYHVPKLARTEIQGNLTVGLEDLLAEAARKRIPK